MQKQQEKPLVQKNRSFPWETKGRFDSYEGADQKRHELLNSDDRLQAKVRLRRKEKVFVVKTRLDPKYTPPKVKKKKKSAKKKKKK